MTLHDLKSGDTVILSRPGFARIMEVRTVDRVTPTKIVVAGMDFRKDDGYQRGASSPYFRGYINIPKDDAEIRSVKDEGRKRFLSSKLLAVKWGEIDLEKLQQIDAILSAPCSTTA